MAIFNITGKIGALTTYSVSGSSDELAAFSDKIKNITTYPTRVSGSEITGKGSKRDISSIRDLVESLVKSSDVKKSGTTGRYIELLSTAINNNLNSGKSWVCDGYTVDKNSLDPSWEGQQICYVYPL